MTLLALLALAINVAVAWGCAAWLAPAEGPFSSTTVDLADGRRIVTTVLSRFGHARVNRVPLISIEQRLSNGALSTTMHWDYDSEMYSETRAGWPLPALRCRNYAEVSLRTEHGGSAISRSGLKPIEGGFLLAPFTGRSPAESWRALPWTPMWTGLLVNTALYALIAWPLVAAPGYWRRRRRRRLGQCEACGYPIGCSPICSECGASVPASAQCLDSSAEMT